MLTTQLQSFPKSIRTRLKGNEYQKFIRSIFERDGWQCRKCGARKNLTPHHLVKRSQLGGDTSGNVITLCLPCHTDVEEHRLKIEVVDVVCWFIEGEEK